MTTQKLKRLCLSLVWLALLMLLFVFPSLSQGPSPSLDKKSSIESEGRAASPQVNPAQDFALNEDALFLLKSMLPGAALPRSLRVEPSITYSLQLMKNLNDRTPEGPSSFIPPAPAGESHKRVEVQALDPLRTPQQGSCSGTESDFIVNGDFSGSTAWLSAVSTANSLVGYDSSSGYDDSFSGVMYSPDDGAQMWMWQSVTFPAQINEASFTFQLHQDIVDYDEQFYVVFYDESFSTTLADWMIYYTLTPGNWGQVTLDLSPYIRDLADQTINVAFYAVTDYDYYHTTYHIDNVSLPVCEPSSDPVSVANAYLKAYVEPAGGRLVLGTTGGDPDTSHDDDALLMYGFPPEDYLPDYNPWTSFATLRVISGADTSTYKLSDISPIVPSTLLTDTIYTIWWFNDLLIMQAVALWDNPYTQRPDTALIYYGISNLSAGQQQVGLRTMLDVNVGNNDGAPYFVPTAGNLIHETEFFSDSIPSYWKAFESASFDPTYLKGQGILKGDLATPPDRFVIGRWGRDTQGDGLFQTDWDYTIDPGAVITEDSAVALYWEPSLDRALSYNEVITFATYYGLAGSGGVKQDNNIWLEAPPSLACNDLDFEVVLWALNNTASTMKGSAVITLPEGLRLASGETHTQTIGNIETGQAQSISWLVAATASPDQAQMLEIEAAVNLDDGSTVASATEDTSTQKPAPVSISIPRCQLTLKPPTNLEAAPGYRSIELSWQPSLSPEAEGYNIYRGSSPGNLSKINAKAVVGTSYQDAITATDVATYYYGVKSVTGSGSSESGFSNIAHAVIGRLELFTPKVHAPHGVTVTIPINIANADGLEIDTQDVRLNYSSKVLKAIDVKKTVLTLNYDFAHQVASSEQTSTVKIITLGNGGKLYGQGTLFQVVFEVVGTQGLTGSESSLSFVRSATEIKVPDPNKPGEIIRIKDLALRDGSFKVQNKFIMGDLNGDGVVNNSDVEIAFKIAVGKLSPNDDQRNVGDINGDGRINSADVALIARLAAGLPPLPSATRQRAMQARAGSEVTVSLDSQRASPGSTLWLPLKVSDAADIAGGDITVNYDVNLVEPVGARLAGLTVGKAFAVESNLDGTGQVRTPGAFKISWGQLQDNTHQDGLSSGPGTLLEAGFKIKASAQSGSKASLTLAQVKLNDPYSRDFATSALQRSISTGDGQLSIGGESAPLQLVYLPLVIKQ